MAYAILGFAVLHAITRGIGSRALVLAGAYAAVIVFGWPILAMSLLGLAETAFNIRGRVASRRGPPTLANLINPTIHRWRETMEVILLERVAKLGQMGDVVRVKDGFARNFLLPKGKALRATKENRSRFETMKVDLEARNLEQKGEAEKIAQKLDGQSFTVLRQAAEGGQLYGSVSPRDIATLVIEKGFAINRAQIALNTPIKTIGLHKVPVSLHPEVEVTINVTVARNADEAERIARGEDITVARDEEEEQAAEAVAAAEAFFEPEVVEARKAAGRRSRRAGGRAGGQILKALIPRSDWLPVQGSVRLRRRRRRRRGLRRRR